MEANGVAVVTGASRGIGRAVAVALADAGFEVIATMRDPASGASLPRETSGRLTTARLDVTDPGSFEMPKGLRVLINNAGADDDRQPIEHMDMKHWRDVFETNFFGPAALAASAIPLLRESGGGVIANVTSSSLLPPCPFMGPYRASKGALSTFGETLQAEVAQFGIRVVEILPGPIETDMMLANKDTTLAAAEYPEYKELATRIWESFNLFRESYPPAEAARRIVAGILEDGGPLRYGCDDFSEQMLKAWRERTSDEAWLAIMQPLLLPPGTEGGGGSVELRSVLVPTTGAATEQIDPAASGSSSGAETKQ